jgi:hypothetical protein
MKPIRLAGILTFAILLSSFPAIAAVQREAVEGVLPPELPWNGKSRALAVAKSDAWATPFEVSGLVASPAYDETVAWLRTLVAAAPQLRMESLGRSPEGREIWMVIASKDRAFTPEAARRSGKPLLFVQAGIHSGEIDGKDAGMMLLRDMTVRGTKRELLDGATFLFVPIFSVDAHERRSPYSRINQRGPAVQGWRTNSRNLNLNRDYTKVDTPEMRAMVRALDRWNPDLYIDVHVTDGADYQYDVTWGYSGPWAWSPATSKWLDAKLRPNVDSGLRAMGHIPGPLTWGVDDYDLFKGIVEWTPDPRFSNGYGNARQIPSILIENHSLKPFAQRVFGTYVFLESTLRTLAAEGSALRKAIAEDRAARPSAIPVSWKADAEHPKSMDFLGVAYRLRPSAVSGDLLVEWTGKPITARVPVSTASVPDATIALPKAYWVPAAWPDVIERLRIHGIRMETLAAPREVDVEMDRMGEPDYAKEPFEGRFRVTAQATPEMRRERYPAGSVRVPTDQPLGVLAAILLDPRSPDSFFQWGFFVEVLERKEYSEGYVTDPTAELMMEKNPALRVAFVKRLSEDELFRTSPAARREWFYERTPYFDDRYMLYPVGREK